MDILGNIGQGILDFYHSGFFAVIKFILGIYATVLLVDIVLLLFQRGLSGDIRGTWTGMNIPVELTTRKSRIVKKWNAICKKMESENPSAWKVAIIEADNVIDDLIKRMGYPGENMGERLTGINPGQIENIEELKLAHDARNKIIHEEGFPLERKEAEKIMGYYENFLKYFEALE
jgi:hypothetical protein